MHTMARAEAPQGQRI